MLTGLKDTPRNTGEDLGSEQGLDVGCRKENGRDSREPDKGNKADLAIAISLSSIAIHCIRD